MKIIINEEQYYLYEQSQSSLFEIEPDYLHKLCKMSKDRESPSCILLSQRKNYDSELQDILNHSISRIYKFFGWKSVGPIPKILQLALDSSDRTVSFLKSISDFIDDESFNTDTTKTQLKIIKDLKDIPDNFEEILKDARVKEYTKYENEFIGKYFNEKRTRLMLNYTCGDDIDKKFLDIVGSSEGMSVEEFDDFFEKIKNCIQESLKNKQVTKADVVTSQPLYTIENGEKKMVFSKNSNFEIKKMDTNIDSYLSEFFSVFKNRKNFPLKESHLKLYNRIIDRIYDWIKTNGLQFLNYIRSNMSGIIYDNYTIVPIEYIEFYWSNLGQRSCTEKRLSIRFRIKPEFRGKEITSYIFNKDSDILEKKGIIVSDKDVEYNVCKIFI